MNRTPLWLRFLFALALLTPAVAAALYLVPEYPCCVELCSMATNWLR